MINPDDKAKIYHLTKKHTIFKNCFQNTDKNEYNIAFKRIKKQVELHRNNIIFYPSGVTILVHQYQAIPNFDKFKSIDKSNQPILTDFFYQLKNILMSWTTNLTMALATERYLAVCRFLITL